MIISPKVAIPVPACLRMDTRMRGSHFEISMAIYQVQYIKTYVCTVDDELSDTWRTVYVDIPQQSVVKPSVVVITVIFLEPKETAPYIHFDNMTLFWDTCENVIPPGTSNHPSRLICAVFVRSIKGLDD